MTGFLSKFIVHVHYIVLFGRSQTTRCNLYLNMNGPSSHGQQEIVCHEEGSSQSE